MMTSLQEDHPFSEPVEMEITDSIDLHAFRPRDTGAVLTAYLEAAWAKGFRFVRIIHGKGIGVQREVVRKALRESRLVRDFKSGDEFSGGWGATIAELKYGD
ncbi:MAG: Smr/MutS family protein [Pyrinomonadaceae bacterium]